MSVGLAYNGSYAGPRYFANFWQLAKAGTLKYDGFDPFPLDLAGTAARPLPADAINTIIRIKTNANSLVIEGTQDCPAFKKIWGSLGGEALPLATDARGNIGATGAS